MKEFLILNFKPYQKMKTEKFLEFLKVSKLSEEDKNLVLVFLLQNPQLSAKGAGVVYFADLFKSPLRFVETILLHYSNSLSKNEFADKFLKNKSATIKNEELLATAIGHVYTIKRDFESFLKEEKEKKEENAELIHLLQREEKASEITKALEKFREAKEKNSDLTIAEFVKNLKK